MKYIRYSKYSPEAAGDIDLHELMSRLSDFFLQSGFENQYGVYEMDMERARQAVERYRKTVDLPVMAQPNAGQPKLVDMKVVYDETPQQMV